MNRILITGGAGFIGNHTADVLLKRGHLVMGIDDKVSHLRHPNFHFRDHWNILDQNLMDVAFHNFEPEYVIHLAASSSLQKSVTNAVYDAQNNIIGTIVILAMCQRYNVKKIVFSSTTAVYAENNLMPLNEMSHCRPVIPYGVSKLACENYIKASGVSYTILRYGNVYGPGQRPLGESILIARILAHIYQKQNFRINGDGSKTRDYVYVSDVVEANIKAMHHPKDDLFLIGTGISHSVNKICNTIGELTDAKIKFPHGPDKPGELQDVKFDTFQANTNLHWRPQIDIESGLKLTVDAWPKE